MPSQSKLMARPMTDRKPHPKSEMTPLMLQIVESIEDGWVATYEELGDEARKVMGAVAAWLDKLPNGLRPSDIAEEVRLQADGWVTVFDSPVEPSPVEPEEVER